MAEEAIHKVGQERLKVRPTVFVALGGTGMEVLLRLRRRILQADWNRARLRTISDFPAAEFFYFDTDNNEGRESNRAAATDPMANAVKFAAGETLQRKVDIARYQRDIDAYPHIKEWLPQQDLSRIDAGQGAGQIRAISRLLFFDVYREFISQVSQRCATVSANLSKAENLDTFGLEVQKDVRVVVVMSAAGGTGSGSFIDAGLAIKSIQPAVSQVDLFMILPSGFRKANVDRVNANAYAALSELEHVMRPSPNPHYAPFGWTGLASDRPSASKPYDDVYFFDTTNVAGESTENVEHLYDMMADVLFEDFGNSDFARRKRSIGVNQMQHKIQQFHPPVPAHIGVGSLAFSAGYSSMGQSTIATTASLEHEAAIANTGLKMMLAFFGVTQAGGKKNVPTIEQRDEFMADFISLRGNVFQDFPKQIKSNAISQYQLVNRLLQRADNSMIDAAITAEVQRGIDYVRSSVADFSEWPAKIRDVESKCRRDVDGGVDAGAKTYGPLGIEIQEARQRLTRLWKAEEGPESILTALYSRLDNYEKGGLDYTTKLVEMITQQLEDDRNGAIARLARAEEQYDQIANEMLEKVYADSMKRLQQAAQGGIMKKGNRGDAETILPQVQEDLATHLKFRLRAIACREAQTMLRDIANHLGHKSAGINAETGEPNWNGIVGDFQAKYRTINQTLDILRHEENSLRDAITRQQTGMFRVIKSESGSKISVDPAQLKDWAQEAFEGFGGCRKLFAEIDVEEKRANVIVQLRNIAKNKLAHYEDNIPSAVDALKAMPPTEQRRLLEEQLARSLPWVKLRRDGDLINGAQYKSLIAVEEKERFESEFGTMIKDVRKAVNGMEPPDIVKSGVRGRIVIYTELSGIPLDAMVDLHGAWRQSFEFEQRKKTPLPVFNHRDPLRFPVPTAPTAPQLEEMQAAIRLFLRGVITGQLRRKTGPMAPYQARVSKDGAEDWDDVGTERTIRRKQFVFHQQLVEDTVNAFEARLTPVQVFALEVLSDWTARQAYAPLRKQLDAGVSTRVGGVAHNASLRNKEAYNRRFRELGEFSSHGGSIDRDAAYRTLFDRIHEWTAVIPESLGDVDFNESNRIREENDGAHVVGVDKRVIIPAKFTTEALLAMIGGSSAQPGPIPPPPGRVSVPPPPSMAAADLSGYAVDLPGIDHNHAHTHSEIMTLIRGGRLTLQTKVFNTGNAAAGWVDAGAVPALAQAITTTPVTTVPPPPR